VINFVISTYASRFVQDPQVLQTKDDYINCLVSSGKKNSDEKGARSELETNSLLHIASMYQNFLVR
jgi:hypothetical protein